MSTKGRTLLVATPTKREPRRNSCRVELCACHDFQPDTATSAVDSDQQTSSLIRWLSGASLPTIDDERVKTQPNHCPNRLHASIAILNAIRDACRQFLEASPSVSTSPFLKDDNNNHPNLNDKSYEDSFPTLPSISSASPPTLLVGRKKNKGPKITSDTNGGGNKSNSWNATNNIITTNIQSQNAINATIQSNGCQMTASGNATSVSPAASTYPLRQTFNSFTFDSDSVPAPSPKTGIQFSTDNEICTDDAEKVGIVRVTNTGIDEYIQQKSERLVLIYVAILRSHLAPSLLLEFHLLLRLLSLSNKNLTRKKTDTNGTQPYDVIFNCEQSCRDFAAKTLTNLESVIVNLGHETLKLFVVFPALQIHCRGLCTAMQDIIYAGKSELIFDADRKALGHITNTPHLTLPFDHARDSRHNYRSAQLNMIYKEREELRDSFLFQLRGFQDIRGRLMEQEQVEKSIVSLQHASREILSNVSPGNTFWFVNFVCDLLLQTGLAPISETDSEVLRQIGDKKRLQKLHMRFTSTSAQANRSSKTLRIDQRGSSTSTASTPDQSFTGHQEFFSIFIRAGDSYTFNMHLKSRLAQQINEMTAVNETKDLYDYIAKTQMLAKFLGMLDFSPNWELAADSIPDRDYDLNTSSINIRKCIEEAWIHNRLVVVIPWVTQYLGMMKWDAVSRRFPYYIDTFALLLSIKHRCFPYQLSSHSFHQTNMMQVSLQLEALFRDVVGLAPSQHLDILNIPTRESATPESAGLISLDVLPLWFSQHTSTSLIPHLKDLHDLLKDLAQNNDKVATTAPKKVRPDTITNLGGMEPNLISQIVLIGQMSPWSIKRSRTPNKNVGIRERLVDSFFHQHKDLQQLCEIVVDRAIKNFAHTASHACIIPIFKHEAASFEEYFNKYPRMTVEEYTKLLNLLDSKAEEAATTLMKDHFDRTITGTLHLLAPPETQTKVVEVASSLAISHAFHQGRNIIHSVIHQEKKKLVEEFIRKEKKFLAGVPLNALKRDRSVEGESIQSGNSFHNLAVLTASLSRLQTMEVDDSAGIDIAFTSLKGGAKKAIEYLQRYFIGAGIPPTVLDFEMHILSALKRFFTNPLHRHLLGAVIEVTDVLSVLGKLGYADTSKQELESLLCDVDNMLTLIGAMNPGMSGEPNPISCESIGNFLCVLLEGSIISSRSLESALLHAVTVNDDAKLVSHVVLNELSVSRTGMADASGRLVIMVRLQRVLLADKIIT